MATTTKTWDGTSGRTNYPFTFPYIKKSDIKVSLDGTETTEYTIPDPGTSIELDEATTKKIKIWRSTNVDKPVVFYSAGSSIRARDLNTNVEHNLFFAQEITDPDNPTNELAGKVLSNTLTATDKDQIPTSFAINSFVLNQLNTLGAFVAIADDQSFPNTNPDTGDDTGTVVSISNAGGLVVNSAGTSTTGRTLGGSTVTITGMPNTTRGTTLSSGIGLLVQTTTTLNTYTYHRLIAREEDIISISDSVDDFANRYRIGGTDPTSNNDDGDLFYNTGSNLLKVWDSDGGGSWKPVKPTDAQMTSINTISTDIASTDDLGSITNAVDTNTVDGSINTVAASISDVNRYAEEYKIAASAPGSPSEGDLWYDTTNNALKFYTGSSWVVSASESGSSNVLDEDDMSSNSATSPPSQQSVKAYVDALNWLDQSTKQDGSVIYWNNSSSKYFADNAQNIKTLNGGNF